MRKTLKILSIALAATLLVALCAVIFAANTEVDAVDYNTGDFATNGDGGRDWNNFVFNGKSYSVTKLDGCAGTITADDGKTYHLIATANQLVGSFLTDSTAQNILIACDITLDGKSTVNNTAKDIIDGLGHTVTFTNAKNGWFNNFNGTVKNLKFAGTINLTGHGATLATWFQGGTVDNVVTDVDLLCNFSGQSNGATFGAYTSGLVGAVQGETTISNCYNNGDIYIVDADTVNTHARLAGLVAQVNEGKKLTITNCHNTGDITHPRAKGNAVAGLVAITYKSSATLIMNGCSNSGTISSNYMAGGLVGKAEGTSTISNCTNTGSISGKSNNTAGIIAQSAKLTISNCVNGSKTDATKGVINGASNTGGLVGYSGGVLDMDNCVNYADVTSSSAAGGLVGKLHAATTIDNSNNWGDIKTTGTNNTDDANAGGGLVGGCRTSNNFKITGCTNNGTVTSTETAYVGGILGTYARNNPNITIDACVNNGDVVLSKASQRYGAAGGVTAGPSSYSLVSNSTYMAPTVTIKNTVNNGDVICQATVYVAPYVDEETGDTVTENAPSDIAGIIARTGNAATNADDATKTTKMTVLIENCVNTGDMIDTYPQESSAAGIIARIEVTEESSSVTIKNSYSTGKFDLASGKGAHALANDLAASKVTVSNYFYINGTDADFAEYTEQVSSVAMAGGYVAYKLGNAFGQTIGTDAAPVIGSTATVYEVSLKATEAGDELAKTYSNTNDYKIISLANAGVQKRADVTGYRVLTTIDAYDYEALKAAGVEFQLGTLITANEYEVSTYEELEAAGKPCVVITAINDAWYDSSATEYTFAGSLLQIKEANLDMEYAVRGYIEIDGTIIYTDGQVVVYNDLVA